MDKQQVVTFLNWITRTGEVLSFTTFPRADTGDATERFDFNGRHLPLDDLFAWARTWLEDQGVHVTDEATGRLIDGVRAKLIQEHRYPPA